VRRVCAKNITNNPGLPDQIVEMDRAKDHSSVINHAMALVMAVVWLAVTGSGCALFRTRVELKTEPEGAEILTLAGEKVATTPAMLEGDALKKLTITGRLECVLSAAGYEPKELHLETYGNDLHFTKLQKLDDGYFSKRVMRDFSQQANELSRKLLGIQGLVITRRLDDAEKELRTFQERYPNVAAGYVLLSNIERLRGNAEKARAAIARAQSLDPDDPVINRMIAGERKTPRPAAAGGITR